MTAIVRQPAAALVGRETSGGTSGEDDVTMMTGWDDQGSGRRPGSAGGVPPLVRAEAVHGTALPLPTGEQRERRFRRDYRREMMAQRRGWRRAFERYATLAAGVARQVAL